MRYIFILFLFFGVNTALANTDQKTAVTKKDLVIKIDSSQVNVRQVDTAAVQKYSKQKDFIYDDVAQDSLSLWQRFWIWFWKLMGKIFGNKASGSIFKFIIILLAIAIVTFFVIKLTGVDLSSISKKSKKINHPFEERLENIHEIDFNLEIEKALANKNYRLAVRLLYLSTLKTLSDKEIINWTTSKTNQAYVQEIKEPAQQQLFLQLTRQFEYVWYGDFNLDKNNFELIYQSFQQFKQQIA